MFPGLLRFPASKLTFSTFSNHDVVEGTSDDQQGDRNAADIGP